MFSLPFTTLLFICLAYFTAAMFDAVCGGGGLIGIPVLMMCGVPIHSVFGCNQGILVTGTVVSFLKYRSSGYINKTIALYSAPVALAGGILGARLNLLLPDEALKIILVILIPVIAFAVLFKKDFGETNLSDTLPRRRMIILSIFSGLLIGIYQGFYGAGSGTFFVLMLTLLLRLDLVTATGTAKPALMLATAAGAATYAVSGEILWQYVLPAIPFCLAGSYAGAKLAVRGGVRVIRPMFVIVLVLLTAKIISEILP